MVAGKQSDRVRAGVLVVLSAVSIMASGCGGKGDVTGSVTYQGKKVMTGTVTLIGSDGIPYHGVIGGDGSYTVRGVPSGPAKVAVHSPNPQDAMIGSRDPTARGAPRLSGDKNPVAVPIDPDHVPSPSPGPPPDKKGEAPPPTAKNWFPIPEHLGDPDRSRITFDVQRGPNTFDIPLDKVPGPN